MDSAISPPARRGRPGSRPGDRRGDVAAGARRPFTNTATAIFGSSAGAKPMNQVWSGAGVLRRAGLAGDLDAVDLGGGRCRSPRR